MNVDGYLINPQKVVRHLLTINDSSPTIAQIYGSKEPTLIRAAIKIQKDYSDIFSWIELNVGCPSPKVMFWGGGSGMLQDKKNTLGIIKSLRKELDIPFSIKTRSGLNLEDKKAQFGFLLEASKYCDMIIVHGRTLKQSHSGEVDRDFVYDLKKQVRSACKILGNGGIHSYNEALEHKKNLDGVMIGQASMGNPRIFVDHEPNLEERLETILEHLKLVVGCELYFKNQTKGVTGKIEENNFILKMPTLNDILWHTKKIEAGKKYFSVIEFRKFLFNYVKGIPDSKPFKVRVSQISDYFTLVDASKEFFENAIQNLQ